MLTKFLATIILRTVRPVGIQIRTMSEDPTENMTTGCMDKGQEKGFRMYAPVWEEQEFNLNLECTQTIGEELTQINVAMMEMQDGLGMCY